MDWGNPQQTSAFAPFYTVLNPSRNLTLLHTPPKVCQRRIKTLMGIQVLNSDVISPAVRKAVIQQLKKGGYKLPSLQSFNVEAYGPVGHVLYAGNM